MTVDITDNHLKILLDLYWDEGAYGFPCINEKRPFGNGDWEEDILDLIKEKPILIDGEEQYTDEQRDRAVKLAEEIPEIIRQLAREKLE